MAVNPCSVCNRPVRDYQRAIFCDLCSTWVHLACTSLDVKTYNTLSETDEDWYCHSCLATTFPFNSIDDDLEYFNSLHNFNFSNRINLATFNNPNMLNIINNCKVVDKQIDPDRNLLAGNSKNSSYFTDSEFNNLLISNNIDDSNFSVLHLNARSLGNKMTEFLTFLTSLTHSFTVITVTETWVNDVTQISIPDYNCFLKPRTGSVGGGVAIYVRNTIHCINRVDLDEFASQYFEFSSVSLYYNNHKHTTVGVVYRPPNTDINLFSSDYSMLLTKLSHEKNKLFITGDFNINLLNYEVHSETHSFLDDAFSHFLYPVITQPTRFSPTSATLIDNIFARNLPENYLSGILLNDMSDHLPVFYVANEKHNDLKSVKYVLRKYRNYNENAITSFANKISNISWDNIIAPNDTNLSYNNFMNIFGSLYNEYFPLITKRIKIINNRYKPWITSGILKSIRRKNALYRNWINNRNEHTMAKYKKYKNKLVTIIRSAENIYFCNRFTELKDDISKTWNLIKSLINPAGIKPDLPKQIKINSTTVKDPSIIANKFNEYFVGIGQKLAKNIKQSDKNFQNYLANITQPATSMFINPTSSDEICNIILRLKNSKSVGNDGISTKIVKAVAQYISVPLSEVFNVSLSTGVFPDTLKIARITPIYKSDDKSCISNYRPISILSVFSKILESIMYTRLITYLTSNKILADNQYGFREKHSTYMALINLVDKISEQIDSKMITAGIFIDLSKAFDTIDHTILLQKMHHYGIRGIARDWFQSYLYTRQQYVQIDNSISALLTVNCGVPQGSTLGPLLFLLYVNDLISVSNIAHIVMFADDTNLFFSENDIGRLTSLINSELKNISDWFKANKLSINIKKTHYILFCSKKKILCKLFTSKDR